MKQILLLIVLLLFMVACTQQQAAIKEQSNVYKIGVMLPSTGDVAVLGQPMIDAVKMAADEINEKGGIRGKKIELVIEDSKCNPKEASTAATKLTSVDKVVAIVGELCSSATLAAAPISEAAKIVQISPASSNYKISEAGDYIFRTFPSDALQGAEGAKLIVKLGYKKAAFFHINNDYGVGFKEVFTKNLAELGGEAVVVEQHNQGDTDFKTQLTKIKNSKPDALYLVSHPAEGAIIMKQLKELGIKIPVVSSEALKDESFIKNAGGAAEGVILTYPTVDMTSSEYKEFAEEYKEYYGKEPGAFVPEAFDAANVLFKAIEMSDGTSEGIKNALYKIQGYKGASGEISFDEKGDVSKPYSVFKVEKGKFLEVTE
ncbi:MAG: penicillin-binding protein activator [Candidatus Woesearchaeota archaeon]